MKESKVKIVEVGPRDGLQNETAVVPTDVKVAFVDALSTSGVDEIEVSAFVSPRWVPQLGDADDVLGQITRQKNVVYSALVPNEIGLARALESRVGKIAVFTSASETFNRKNINTSIDGAIQRFRPVVRRAHGEGLPVRGYVSAAFWCAFEGQMAPKVVLGVVDKLVDIGVDEVSISDTTGKATPDEVARLLELLLAGISPDRVAMHFHDTYGRGVENALASWSYGIRTFDASVGGLGGCPYAPGATGNVATESVVKALREKGAAVGVDLGILSQALRLLKNYLVDDRRTLPDEDSPACAACEYVRGQPCCREMEV